MVELVFQMYTDDNDDNFKNRRIIFCHVSGKKSQDERLCFIFNKDRMYWSRLSMQYNNGKGSYKYFCYSETPPFQVIMVSIGKGTKCLLFSFRPSV